jgi:hypothetical protein
MHITDQKFLKHPKNWNQMGDHLHQEINPTTHEITCSYTEEAHMWPYDHFSSHFSHNPFALLYCLSVLSFSSIDTVLTDSSADRDEAPTVLSTGDDNDRDTLPLLAA